MKEYTPMSDAAVAMDYEPEKTEEDETGTQSGSAEGQARDVGGVAGQRLRSFIDRIERLEEEKAHLAEDIKETYAEAKGVGFDTKTIRKIISLRKMDAEKRRESEELLDLYKSAIGML
jgi:uncharacterized protein (UPF0335 family)